MRWLSLLAFSLVLSAGEAAPVGPSVKDLRQIQSRCLQANDVWSALQISAYAKSKGLDVRPPPSWAGVEILGDPIFACPHTIEKLYDTGREVIVVTGAGVHRFAPEGYPLAPSIRFGFMANNSAISPDGGFVAALDPDETKDNRPQTWRIRVVATATGTAVDFSGGFPLARGRAGNVAVADDGSAVAVGFSDGPRDDGVVVVTAQGSRTMADLNRVEAVGPGGSWVVTEPGEQGKRTLVLRDRRTAVGVPACSHGFLAAVATTGELLVIGRNGDLVNTGWPANIGAESKVHSVGRWLAIAIAGNAPSSGVAGWQPKSTLVFSWEDIAIGSLGAAERTYRGLDSGIRLPNRPASLGRWSDRDVSRIDLDGEVPTESPIATFDQAVNWVAWNRRGANVAFENDAITLIDDAGAVVGASSGDVLVLDRGYAVRQAPPARLLRLSVDPLARSSVPLEMPPGHVIWSVDPHHDGLYASNAREWMRFGDDGRIAQRGPLKEHPCPWIEWPLGGYFHQHARVFPKSGPRDPSITRRLSARDAWTTGKSLIILGLDGRLCVSGRKRGEFTEIAEPVRGSGFGRSAGKDDLMTVDDSLNPCSAIVTATATTVSEPPSSPTEALPPGPWQVDRWRYAVPNGPSLEWDAAKTGFQPERLRSWKDGPGLVVVTRSLVLCLDAAAAKAAGRK